MLRIIFGLALAFLAVFSLLGFIGFNNGCATTETKVLDKYHHCGGPGEVRCRVRAFQAQPWECCK